MSLREVSMSEMVAVPQPMDQGHVESAEDVKKLSGKVDEALQFTVEHEDITWTEAEERRVKRKIDMVVLPLLFIGAIVYYADGQVYGFAAIFGLIQDLGLYTVKVIDNKIVRDTSKYSFTAGMPFLGTVVSLYPLLLIAQRISAGKFLGVVGMFAGMLAMLTIVCRGFADVMAVRFFYGWQSVGTSLSIIITTMWWKTNEQGLRVGVWVTGAGFGSLIGQAIDFGGIHIGGTFAASPWKWLYVIFGSIAIGFGIILVIMLPANPMKAWFLNERERTIAVKRLINNHTGIQTKTYKAKHIIEALTDPQLLVFCIFSFTFSYANNAGGTFGGLLVTSFGYTREQAILIGMLASAVAIVCISGSGMIISRFPNYRLLIAVLFLLPTIAGSAILWKAPRTNLHALLAGLYMSQIFYGAVTAVASLIASNVGGHTKKTTVNAMNGIFSACGGFTGPWAYKAAEATRGYPTGQASTMALMALSSAALLALWWYYDMCNKRKAAFTQHHIDLVQDPKLAFHDLTDKENPVFQYAT